MDSESGIELVSILINLGIPVLVIMLAMITGTILEKRHFKIIHRREKEFLGLPAIPSRDFDRDRPVAEAIMTSGSVVVSLDHFKKFLAALRNIFGGRVRSYESLLDRGRREAILRMKEQCPNADIIVNFRVMTSTVGNTYRKGKQRIGAIEVLAYGTAITYADRS